MKAAFYNSPDYKKRQSTLIKSAWKNGAYNHLRKTEKRICARDKCNKSFLSVPSDLKKYCSHSCAAKINNSQRKQNLKLDKKELTQLYNHGFSSKEIAEKLNVSNNKINYWLEQFKIPKRSISEAIYLKHNPNGDPFRIKKDLTPKERQLLGLGLGIYWGEGNKVKKGAISVSNSDYKLIQKFIEFLIKICRIDTSKLGFSLQTFNDVDPKKSLEYWCKKLKVTKEEFGKIVITPPLGKGTYKRKSQYGVCAVTFSNIKLKKWLMSQLR